MVSYVIKQANGKYAVETCGKVRTGYAHKLIRACEITSMHREVRFIAMHEDEVDEFINLMNKVHNDLIEFVVVVSYL